MDANALTIAIIAALPGLAAAAFAYRASAQANRTADRKVDAEAYERSQAIYEKTLSQADQQIDRLRQQVERLNEQLASEQDLSNSLRNQVRSLQTSVATLETTLTNLRSQLAVQTHPLPRGQPGGGRDG